MDTPVAIWAILVYIIVCVVINHFIKTRHRAFWWMVFLSPPVGAIIALLLDIKETAEFNFIRGRDIEDILLTKK